MNSTRQGAEVYDGYHPASGYRLLENLVHLAHQIANGETHKLRGDAGRVKAIEIGYKDLGVIQSNRVAAQASATVVAPQGQTVFEIYKSKWLLDKEAAMAARLEEQNGK